MDNYILSIIKKHKALNEKETNSTGLHVLQQRNKTEINSRLPRKFSHAGRMKVVDLIKIVYKKG